VVDPAQRNERALVLALVAALLLWNLPFGGLVLFPFKLLATWLHEMSHGVTMLATGAGFSHLEIYRDTSGIAFAERGVGGAGRAVIASAGYMGAALLGGAMLVLGQSGRRARGILLGFAIALALSLVFWVRNDFGMSAVAIGALMCAAMARFAPEGAALLLRPTLVINGEVVRVSDAHNMAAASFGSHWLWAGLWLGFSFVCLFAALRITHLRQRRPGPDGDHEPDREPDRELPGDDDGGGAKPGPA